MDGLVWFMRDDSLSSPTSHFLALKLSIDKKQKDPNVLLTNHLTLPSTKLQFTVGLLIKFNLTLPEGNDIVLQQLYLIVFTYFLKSCTVEKQIQNGEWGKCRRYTLRGRA